MDVELKLLKSKIRYLEDKNFIIETKLKVLESITKNSCLVIELLKLIFSLEYPYKIELFDFFDNYLEIPNVISSLIFKQILDYENHLDNERKKFFKEFDYKPYKIEEKANTFHHHENIKQFKDKLKNIVINLSFTKNYSSFFLDDLSVLIFKHNINFNVNEFVNLFEATKFIFRILSSIYLKFPILTNFNGLNENFESLIQFVEEKFEMYSVTILERNKFVPDANIYLNSLVELFINNLNDKIVFKNTFIELMKEKSFYIEKYTSLIDQRVFNKFSQTMLSYNKVYDKPKLKFQIEEDDILDFSNYMNICFSIGNFDSECESFMNNYLIENILLRKFLKCAVEQIGVEKKNIDVVNPIRALINFNKSHSN
jgi:hypothetical protein